MKWRKASDKLPPTKVKVIIKDDDGHVYDDIAESWDKHITDYQWLDESSTSDEEEISGIKEYDDLVKQYKSNEITFNQFACRLWNKANFIGHNESPSLSSAEEAIGERTFTLKEAIDIHTNGIVAGNKQATGKEHWTQEQYFKDKFGIDI